MTDDVDVLVMGGGPAGSTAAAMAAKAGARVVLLDAGAHPRAHVGESLLPGITPVLADIGALDAVRRAGFSLKTGSTHLGWGTTPRWDLWFADSDAYETSWFVERARFDALLSEAAAAAGAHVRQRCPVRRLTWDGDRIGAVTWTDADGTEHEARARHVIDATGAAALVARDRGWVEPIDGMAHQALWAHFEQAEHLASPRQHQAAFIAESGHWLWCFPLPGGRASVGVVELDTGDGSDPGPRGTAHFDARVSACDALARMLGPNARRASVVRRERDWSYRVRPAGFPGTRLVGDAAGFIDPVLSTGVFLAMHSAWDAARTLGQTDEAAAAAAYARRHARQFDDLLRMVCFYYQQGLSADDYFWESKRIVIDEAGALSPRRAFLVLTSGLIDNLAVADATTRAKTRRRATVQADAANITADGRNDDNGDLGFFCIHLQVDFAGEPSQRIYDPGGEDTPRPDRASVYIVVEPDDPALPCLARSASLSIDVVAPRLGNDARQHPVVGPVLDAFVSLMAERDTEPTSVAAVWRAHGAAIERWGHRLPAGVELVRVFGR